MGSLSDMGASVMREAHPGEGGPIGPSVASVAGLRGTRRAEEES